MANMKQTTYRIEATKRNTGEVVQGTTQWDGLASLHSVRTAEGEWKYVSVLDDITLFEPVN